MSTTVPCVGSVSNCMLPELAKANAEKALLQKELNKIDEKGFSVEIEPGSYKLIVNASSQRHFDQLFEKYPDLKFKEITFKPRVVRRIVA